MSNVTLLVKRLPNLGDLPLPTYATIHSAGLDLLAAVEQDMVIRPMERVLVPTGISIALPDGYEAQIRPRSGLALKHGISIPNSPGTIDADYRGEVQVLAINLSDQDFIVTRGMRLAQMVVARYSRVNWNIVEELPDTERSTGGFGSTGIEIKMAS